MAAEAVVLFDPARGFILRLRRPPRVSPTRPLEGLTITVDRARLMQLRQQLDALMAAVEKRR